MFQTNDFLITIHFKSGIVKQGVRRHAFITEPIQIRKLIEAKMKGNPDLGHIEVIPTAKALGKEIPYIE
jgi:hypothetical protein